jgi:hypothetical protein
LLIHLGKEVVMLSPLRNLFSAGFCAVGLSLLAPAAQANLVTNGSFETTTGTGPKDYFTSFNPTGWSGGTNLTFLDGPGTADNGTYLSVYGAFPNASPNGGNFVEADAAPSYSSAISQSISGLQIGQTYSLTFYQAAGQQTGFTGPTTEEWAVTFGATTQDSLQFSLNSTGADVGPWQLQTMTFVATSVIQTLSFLAVGTPDGEPPIAFLDGVDLEPVPEPASLTLFSIGVLGVAAAARRRRAKRAETI